VGRTALALDIGATKLAVALVAPDGGVIRIARTPTLREDGPDAVLGRLFALADGVLDGAAPTATGVACGGPLDTRAGVLLGPLHLPGWERVEIVRLVQQRFGAPAVLVNDASAGAWGEHRVGAAAGAGSSVYLTVSSGLGGGAVLDGRLLTGATTNGGEFGHVLVRPGGRRCTCGRRGCAEAYVAGTQLVERAREAMAAGRASCLTDVQHLDAAAIVRAADRDGLAHELWTEALDCLGQVVTDLVNVLEPEVVVLDGGLTREDALLEAVRAAVSVDAMAPVRQVVRVARATLGGSAPAVGAGLLALAHLA
jgi:glucokinase